MTVGLGHLQEGIDLTNSWDIIGDEGLDLGLEINLLRLIALNVLKHLLQLLCNWQVCILVWIISSRDFLLILIVVVIVLLLGMLHLLLLRLRGLLLLGLGLDINIYINFIFLLIAVDLFRIIDIDSQIEWLVFNLVSLDIVIFSALSLRSLRRSSIHGLSHGIVR